MSRVGSDNSNWRGGYASTCDICNAPVWVKPSRASRKYHYCSKACQHKGASIHQRGENASGWAGGNISRVCLQCGKSFSATKCEVARGGGNYCSRECFTLASRKAQTVLCDYCGIALELPPNRLINSKLHFCSNECKRKAQIKTRTPSEMQMRKLNLRISSLMGYSLKGAKDGCKWEFLVGYSLSDLKQHLESQFKDGMSWQNMGEWHIDHIKPRCLFHYDSPDDPEFLKCWALSNLQPLWAVDNLIKGSKYPITN